MAMLASARRFYIITNSSLFKSVILRSIVRPPVLLYPAPKSRSLLVLAFHQTRLIHSENFTTKFDFSTNQHIHTQNFKSIVPFDGCEFRIHEFEHLDQVGIIEILSKARNFASEEESISFLDQSGFRPCEELVSVLIWAVRDELESALLAFKWGERRKCNGEKSLALIVWVLGSQKKFNSSWSLIRDFQGSLNTTRKAMLVLMDRYAAAHDPSNAIKTFNMLERFSTIGDVKAFHSLLSVLCKYGNIEEAEEFMFLNKKLFPLETEGFNIILNGWCNISVDMLEAKRIWREMSKCCISPNSTSYTHMISGFSKVGNLFDSLRLYDEMKKRDWVPGLEAYNSLIHVLTRENCLKEALKILDKIKERGLQTNSATYNSMIGPLCEAQNLEDARTILTCMIADNVRPTVETYHSFLEAGKLDLTLEILDQMKKSGFDLQKDTFLSILNKFFKLGQPDSALRIWVEMKKCEINPDSAHYIAIVQGLASCGWLNKSRELYDEMKSKGFPDDPKLKKLLMERVKSASGKKESQFRVMRCIKRDTWVHQRERNEMRRRKH
ncbi:Pentatricopeptide repeat [Dillenia turbinata]|uniref:Pentatricopeptide repeat n=1 Tax=Dillenia turbinata TaxID=194707 RepID=A0AAN8YTY3_9MAGN